MPVVLPSLVPSIVVPVLEGSITSITERKLVIVAELWWVVTLSIAIGDGRAGRDTSIPVSRSELAVARSRVPPSPGWRCGHRRTAVAPRVSIQTCAVDWCS